MRNRVSSYCSAPSCRRERTRQCSSTGVPLTTLTSEKGDDMASLQIPAVQFGHKRILQSFFKQSGLGRT